MMLDLTANEALDLWRRVLVANVREGRPDLSSRQLALVLTVYLTAPPHTVRGLAAFLNISKPAVTRALDRLRQLGLVRRKAAQAARRTTPVPRTPPGSGVLGDAAARGCRT